MTLIHLVKLLQNIVSKKIIPRLILRDFFMYLYSINYNNTQKQLIINKTMNSNTIKNNTKLR